MYSTSSPWKWVTVLLAIFSTVMAIIITSTTLADDFWNARTVHMEEYYSNMRPINPQSFWGLVWGVGQEFGTSVNSVAATTCFKHMGGIGHGGDGCKRAPGEWCQSMVDYKNNVQLCGPNLWQMDASCSHDESSRALINAYLQTLNMQTPDEKTMKMWMKGDFLISDTDVTVLDTRQGSKWNGELCRLSKIKPIVSFATDSHSYSFMASGNACVYIFTTFAIIAMAYLSEFCSLEQTAQYHNMLQVLLLFAVYVIYFVLWNRNTSLSMASELVFNNEWKRDDTCKGTTCKSVWSTGDSCTASILLTWIVFSYYSWLVWSTQHTKYKEEERKPTRNQVAPSLWSTKDYLSVEDPRMLLVDADINLKNYPTATSDMNHLPSVEVTPSSNISQSTHIVGSTILFVFPLLVAACTSSRKFSLDTFVQSRLMAAVIFSVLQYVFMIIDWFSNLFSLNGNDSAKRMKKVVFLMQLLIVTLQVLVLTFYFVYQFPSGYSGFQIIYITGFIVIAFNVLQWLICIYNFVYSIDMVENHILLLHRVLFVFLSIMIIVVYFMEFHNSNLVKDDIVSTDSKFEMVRNHWVYGINYQLPESYLSYAIPASYL